MASRVVVRTEGGPDSGEHVESYQRALDEVARERKYLALLEAPPLPHTRAYVRSNIEIGNPFFVAVANEDVVGWCNINRLPFPVHRHRGTFGIGIVPAYRGSGLGTRLLGKTLEAAFKAGFVRIEGDVYTDNEPAIALYEKVGFVKEGIIRDAVFADGAYRDSIFVALIRRS
ncbi:GNAT family N-acetyltransferase [Beijerinckia sp. L45]|uniref:GNAT family N-acetyltransferase n=1 Tax=Beijerinckia sp. L45 TaxID=1641855 RepID=UPI00131E8407|nr:GNAT family protein [Beijerinckia sp. L45]